MPETDPENLAERTVLHEGLEQNGSHADLPSTEIAKDSLADRKESAQVSTFRPSIRRTTASRDFNTIDIDSPFVHFITASVLFVLLIAVSVSFVASTYAWPTQLSWPIADGQVKKIEVRGKRAARFYYDYSIGNRPFEGMNLKSDSLEHTIKVGDKVHVRYNPSNNLESVMEGGFNVLETPFYLLVCCGLFSAFIVYFGKGLRKFRS